MKTIAHTMNPFSGLAHSHAFRSLKSYLAVLMFAALLAGCSGSQDATPKPVAALDATPVTAKAGPIVAARIGETPVLDGSRSTTTLSGTIKYHWSFAHKPYGSKAKLQGSNSENPTFTADVSGVYTVQLVTSVNGINSQRAVQIVVVTRAGEPLTGPVNHPGLTSDCVTCHNGSLVDPGKSPNHIGTSNLCQACHTPQNAALIHYVDHKEVFGNCSQCHDGTIAIGKSASHVETTAECDSCHNTDSFISLGPDGKFDHSNIRGGCSGCHNGSVAIGKTKSVIDGGTHPDTDSECINCHTTKSFLNAYPDHSGPDVVGPGITCDSCHVPDGSGSARGQSAGHPVTSVDCVTCHGTATFDLGGIFNHRLVDQTMQSCESCHNDSTSINAPAKSSAPGGHVATTADCGQCHNTDVFKPAFGVDHTGIIDNCQTCHGNNSPGPGEVTATGKPLATPFYAHMPTNPDNPGTASDEDCAHCHTPGTFSTGTYDHAGVSSGCNACHDNRIGVGKLPNHIPTTPDNQDCADCHTTVDFTDVSFDHTSTDTSNCLACHDGNIAKGQSQGHIKTSENCSSCHLVASNNYTTFADTFDHNPSLVNGDCASCHNTGIAKAKKVNHIPAQAECYQCHRDTTIGGFINASQFTSVVHPTLTSGCEGCHTSQFIADNPGAVKSNSHLPTAQDCDVCHVNSAFLPSIFSHSGITGNCKSCHDGSTDNRAAGAKGKVDATNHPATTSDCNACHSIGNNFTDGTFDHTGIVNNCSSCHGDNPTSTPVGPKKNAGHLQTTEDCSVCHVPGTFVDAVFDHQGIVDNCASCHDGANAIGTIKPGSHLPTNEDCSLCHNTTAFAGAHFDHKGIVDNCASCHDGTTASGKTPPPDHVPTSEDCSVCHQTTGFLPATFSHDGIVDNCVSCHNGAFAQDKSANHVATNQDCGVCHTTSEPLSFAGATFNHTGIVDNCESCHYDGGPGIGKGAKTNPPHLDTSLDCHHCHTTATFVGGRWIHDSSTAGNCDSCHRQNGDATPKSSGHLDTNEQCDVCHTTEGWAPTNFQHSANGNYPGDHRRAPGCTRCHRGSIGSGINSDNYPNQLQYAPFCAGCHANDFERKDDHNGGNNGTIEQNKDCSGGGRGCHRVTDSNFD